ncbi:hypothetical protein [Paractinoplanes durhamensis]|uniref:hypothetical protein n=1 Tax=Paractinoplanes durhamensis TaxID=113563 RepID=UPI0036315107
MKFTLDARTLDGGEQVVAVILDTSRLGRIDPASLTTGTFTVHAKATSPIPLAPGDQIFSEYDLDRPVTRARLDRHGDIVLDLSYAEGQLGGGTLGYIASKGRNVQLDLVYTITQNKPIAVRHGAYTIKKFVQGRLSNPEVDAFGYRTSGSGMKIGSTPAGTGGGRSSSGCTVAVRVPRCRTTTTTTRPRCGPTAVRSASPLRRPSGSSAVRTSWRRRARRSGSRTGTGSRRRSPRSSVIWPAATRSTAGVSMWSVAATAVT